MQLSASQQERLANESHEERETRLMQLSASQQERLANESHEERETRLMQLSASQQKRLANESHEERETRLMQLSASQQERLANETHEGREARLLQLNTACKIRQSYESPQDRKTRLSRDRERHRIQQALRVQLPLLNERSVQTKVSKFHEHMSSLSVSKCSVCMEQLRCNATECVRCSRDKSSPKLYSPGNNMDPGSQPLELQVSILYDRVHVLLLYGL